MISSGEKIKYWRKKKNMSQIDLSIAICTQATISNIENNRTTPSDYLLEKLAIKLDVEVELLFGNQKKFELKTLKHLQIIEQLFVDNNYKNAYSYLNKKINRDSVNFLTNRTKKRYFYFLAMLELMVNDDFKLSQKYFTVLNRVDKKIELENILSLLGQGYCFISIGDLKLAEPLFLEALSYTNRWEKVRLGDEKDLIKIYYFLAKYFNFRNEFELSLGFCDKAIGLCNDLEIMYYLPALIYERSLNLAKLNRKEECLLNYKSSYYLAELKNNDFLKKLIIKDLSELGISL